MQNDVGVSKHSLSLYLMSCVLCAGGGRVCVRSVSVLCVSWLAFVCCDRGVWCVVCVVVCGGSRRVFAEKTTVCRENAPVCTPPRVPSKHPPRTFWRHTHRVVLNVHTGCGETGSELYMSRATEINRNRHT